jgi:hypothetical protein
MTTLRELHLCETKITDEGLERVAGLTNLKILDLWRGQEPPQYGGTRVPAVVPSFVTENVQVGKSIALDVTSVGEHEH